MGILAAKKLALYGIHINLFLVSGLMHAAACVEAKAFAITMAVGTVRNKDLQFTDGTLTRYYSWDLVARLARTEAEHHFP